MILPIRAIGFCLCIMLSKVISAGELTLGQIIDEHCRARQATTTIKAKFTQTKVFTLFEEIEISRGTLFFARPNRICWQYSEPDKSITVINDEVGWSVFPHIKQVQKFKLDGSKTNKILSIIGFGMCGAPLKDYFDIELGRRSIKYIYCCLNQLIPILLHIFHRSSFPSTDPISYPGR